MEFVKENGEVVEGKIHNYEMSNDGWYYEPEELPDSWVETMIIELENARSISHRFIKPARVIMGDDGQYWVTTTGEASILEKAGYEIVY